MAISLASLRSDLDREAKGDWVPSNELPGVRFRVSSLHTPAYVTARDLLVQRWARKYRRASVPQDVRSKEMGSLFCKHILHEWDGLDEPYTPEKALEVLTDPAFRTVLSAVENCASELGEANIEFVEEAAKNSGASSAKG